jgi:SAM-dependent methyltransferase
MSAARTWEDAVRWLIEQPSYAETVRDCYYDPPLARAAARYLASDEFKAVLALLPPPPGKALDLGAGNGISSYALARAGYQVTAVEPDASALVGRGAIAQLAAEEGLAIAVREGTGERIPLRTGELEVVFARQVLHHARDLPALCAEMARVLRPGGRLVAVRDHVITREADLPTFLANHPLHRLYGGENAYRLSEYRRALEGAGFRIVTMLRSFDSVINYYPHTRATLRAELIRRSHRVPIAGGVASALLANDRVFDATLALLSRVDRRPGRLVSFVCDKAEGWR